MAHRCPLHGSGPESVGSNAGATYHSHPAQSTRSLHIAWPRTQEKRVGERGREGGRKGGRAKSLVTAAVPSLRRLVTLICGISPKSLQTQGCPARSWVAPTGLLRSGRGGSEDAGVTAGRAPLQALGPGQEPLRPQPSRGREGGCPAARGPAQDKGA